MTIQHDLALLGLYNERAAELKESTFLLDIRAESGPVFHLHSAPFGEVRRAVHHTRP